MASVDAFSCIWDTSALITYFADEPGADQVEASRRHAAIPFMALSELYYLIWQRQGKASADTLYGLVRSWSRPVLMPDEQVVLTAGRLKAVYRLGIADSYIAAFSLIHKKPLMTKDPDYESLVPDITLTKLPYKKSRS